MNLFEQQQHEFTQRHIGPNAAEAAEMLNIIGASSLDELIGKTLPASIRMDKPLNTGWRHPGRNLVEVRSIVVRLRPPAGQRVSSARLATSEMPLSLVMRNGACEVTVPKLADHEIVIFELSE